MRLELRCLTIGLVLVRWRARRVARRAHRLRLYGTEGLVDAFLETKGRLVEGAIKNAMRCRARQKAGRQLTGSVELAGRMALGFKI